MALVLVKNMASRCGGSLSGVQLEPVVWRWLESLPYETRQSLMYDDGGNYESARNLRRLYWRAHYAPEPVRSLALAFAADLDDGMPAYNFAGCLPATPAQNIDSTKQSKIRAKKPGEKTTMYRIGNWIKAKDAEGQPTGKRFLVIAIPPDGVLNLEAVEREKTRDNDPTFEIVYHGVPVGALWLRKNNRDGGEFLSGKINYRGMPYDELAFIVPQAKDPNQPGEVIHSPRDVALAGDHGDTGPANTESAATAPAGSAF